MLQQLKPLKVNNDSKRGNINPMIKHTKSFQNQLFISIDNLFNRKIIFSSYLTNIQLIQTIQLYEIFQVNSYQINDSISVRKEIFAFRKIFFSHQFLLFKIIQIFLNILNFNNKKSQYFKQANRKFQTYLIKRYQTIQTKMGCSQSTQVLQRKPIQNALPVEQKIIKINKPILQKKQIPERGECFLIGSLSQTEQVFAHVKLQTMTINKMSLPSGGFKCNNFSSILQIQKSKYFITGGINHDLTNISNQAYIYYSEQHRVQKVSQMKQARYTHVSIFSKRENEVYVVGGRFYGDDSKGILSDCEKYSLKEQKWVKLPEMNVKRCTCFILTWKQIIYVFGGYTGPFERSTKIQYLDKQQKQWILLDVQIQRGIQGAILLPTNNNQVTIFGGLVNSGPTSSVVTINLLQKSIKSNIKLQQQRSLHKSFYKNGKVYIFGGDDNFTSQIYDIQNKRSQLIKKQYPFSLQQFDSFGVSTASVEVLYNQNVLKQQQIDVNDQVLYIFGTTEEPFICSLNISIPEANFYSVPLNLKLYAHQGGVMISNHQFILFGGIQDDSLSVINSDTYFYDIKTNIAKKMGKMNQSRYAFAYNSYSQNKNNKIDYIYCFCGATSNVQGKLVFLSACQRFSIKQQKWELILPLPEKVISPMSIAYKDNFFVFGGTNEKNQKVKDIFMYSIKQNTWTTLQSKLQFGIQAGSITQVSANQFYIFGGRLQNGLSSGIWSIYLNQKVQNKKKQITCIFQQKGNMNQKKSLHKIYKPDNQDFYVVFGGEKYPLSFYRKNLQEQTSDLLLNMKQMFTDTLKHLNHKNLSGYLMINEEKI